MNVLRVARDETVENPVLRHQVLFQAFRGRGQGKIQLNTSRYNIGNRARSIITSTLLHVMTIHS